LNAPAKRIDALMSIPYSNSDYSGGTAEQSDGDSWLFNGEEDLAAALQARQKEMDAYESKQEKRKSDKITSAGAENSTAENMEIAHAAEVVKNMQSFVDKISSFEGAEIPGNE
jgi:hypothetical protein